MTINNKIPSIKHKTDSYKYIYKTSIPNPPDTFGSPYVGARISHPNRYIQIHKRLKTIPT